jgi:hypothetical protein
MQGSLITASKSESEKVNAGELARAWRPRHVHVRSLKVRSEVMPRGSKWLALYRLAYLDVGFVRNLRLCGRMRDKL